MVMIPPRAALPSGTKMSAITLRLRHRRQHPVPVRLEFCPQALHLAFHLADALVHADDDLDAGEVQAQVLDEALDVPQPRHVRLRVEALSPHRAARADEADALVVAQALRVQAYHSGGYADHVAGLFAFVTPVPT